MCAVNTQLDDFFSSYTPSLSSSLRENRTERMKLLLERIGNPEKRIKTIHVAGSKGKGTTATALSFILSGNGKKTGLFLSPHVYDIRERFTLSSVFFSDGEYLSSLEKLKELISGFKLPPSLGDEKPTTFELYTAYSYLLFSDTLCEWAVIETGLGGRLDATNTLLPLASVITRIELEHTQILGDTLEKIALEKAGIIKKNTPVFVLDQKKEVLEVIRETAESLQSPIHIFRMPENAGTVSPFTFLSAGVITSCSGDDVLLLDIFYALYILYTLGFDVSGRYDFTSPLFRLPGRYEERSVWGRRMIFDGAHTPVSAALLSSRLRSERGKKRTLIFSTAHDKDHKAVGGELVPLFDHVIITSTGRWKKSRPEKIYEDFTFLFPDKDIMLILDFSAVIRKALELTAEGETVVAAGSFYLLSELDSALAETGYGC